MEEGIIEHTEAHRIVHEIHERALSVELLGLMLGWWKASDERFLQS